MDHFCILSYSGSFGLSKVQEIDNVEIYVLMLLGIYTMYGIALMDK